MNEFKVELTCKTCGEKFVAYKHAKRKYCSRACGGVGKQNREIRTCAYCGEAFERPLHLLNSKPGMYCSILCSNRAKDRKWFKTMVRTPEHCAKIAESRMGEKNPMWKGGITPENTLLRVSGRYRKWRNATLATDDNKCTMCGDKDNLEAHHMDLFSKNKSARFDPNNGLTLCQPCHKDVHSFDSTPDIQSYAFGVV